MEDMDMEGMEGMEGMVEGMDMDMDVKNYKRV